MNIAARNAAETSTTARELAPQTHRADKRPVEMSTRTTSSEHLSADQANFERQLQDLQSAKRTSDSAPAPADSEIRTSSAALNEAPWETERYPAASFARARAQLAATLTGATLGALKNEIDLAAQQTTRWSPAIAAPEGPVDRDRIFDDVAGSSYVKLHRFQNQDADCKPRTEANTTAISHARNTARDHSSVGDPLERYPMDRARQAGWHMRGKTAVSPFVSLVEDPSKLAVSLDPWARAIGNNTNTLHSYMIPKSAVWTPDDVLRSIGLGMNVEDQDNIDADVDLMCSLGRTPTRETERLFLGGNLEDYRTASEANPYRARAMNR
ncbi:hypothetical protein [Mesorhizobium sp. WSM3224]|uniref:hypothetical protein n=1 Tax=Mesorhizobium sp. WSM3224 TaxID=1040986 RepID=UPI0004891EDD|nr:hypothetical protein [Mesorhizobium sp. WSM3224]